MCVNALWPESEIMRFRSRHSPATSDSLQPFNTQERKWLKDHYGGEFHFLQTHGLSIYKDEDRTQGAKVVRAIMAHEMGGIDDVDEDEQHSDRVDQLAHQMFNAAELEFIKRDFVSIREFMEITGLDEDC